MYYSSESLDRFRDVTFRFITTKQEGNLFSLVLNRPSKRNAFTPTMVCEIAFALEFANKQKQIWCVLVEAEGPVFCAGMDLNVFQNPDLDEKNETLPPPEKEISLGDAFKNLRKPCVVKVKGDVLAGGFLIIGGSTFVVANEEAKFSLPEVKRGIFPMQVMATLLKIMSPRKVLEMCILAKVYSAKEALDLGLVSFISTKETIDNDTNTLINTILENAPYAIQKGIDAFHAITDIPEEERHFYLMKQLRTIKNSEDAQEGIMAFQEKRKATWKNN